MDKNLHNIDDLFRKALDEYEEAPSPSVWQNLDRNLDKKKVVSISQKYKRLKWVAAALLIFSMGMAMYAVHTRMKSKELVRENNLRKKKPTGKTLQADNTVAVTGAPATNDHVTKGASADTAVVVNNKSATTGQSVRSERALVATEGKKVLEKAGTTTEKAEGGAGNNKTLETPTAPGVATRVENAANRNLPNARLSATQKSAEERDGQAEYSQRFVPGLATVQQPKDNLRQAEPGLAQRNPQQRISLNSSLTANNTSAKTSKQSLNPFKRPALSATVFYSPDLVWARVDADRRRFREDDRNEIKSKEQIKRASTVGVLVDLNTGKGFSIETGLSLSTMTTGIQPKMIFARPDERGNVKYRFNCFAGYSFVTLKPGMAPVAGDSVTALGATNTLKYVSVPVTLKYNVRKGKLGLHPGVGIAANILTKGKIDAQIAGTAGTEKTTIDHIEGLNKSYLSGLISFGASYNLTNRLSLSVSPVARFALSAINKDAPVKTFLNSFGVAAGITIGL